MTSRISAPFDRSRPGRTAAVAGALLLALPLAACGSTAAPSSPAGSSAPTASPRPTGQPGVVGLVAAVKGSEAEVQNPSMGQVAVDVSARTTITARTAGTLRDVRAGDCVTASGTPATGGAGLTARTVTVTAATAGSCTERRGPGNGRPSPVPRLSGMPSPSGSARTATVSGTVSAVSGGTITVNGVLRTPGVRAATPPPDRLVTVTTDTSTRIQRDVHSTRAAVRPGVCVAAVGPSNDIGAIQARTVTVFQPGNTGCTGGFAGRVGGSNG